MIGARGLGENVLQAIQTLDIGRGVQAGAAIVILAPLGKSKFNKSAKLTGVFRSVLSRNTTDGERQGIIFDATYMHHYRTHQHQPAFLYRL